VHRVHVILTTHTTRHLRRSLLGVAVQGVRPGHVVVSCDNDEPAIAELVRECTAEFDVAMSIVQRPNMGGCRVGQARNNGLKGVRALGAADDDRVLYFDGDICPAKDVVEIHRRRGAAADLLIGFRIELTEGQTEVFDEAAVCEGRPPAAITAEQIEGLSQRDARYRRQLFLRKLHLTKPHKPKLLSAHFSVSVRAMERVNGFDEEFTGWGQEDDDLGRRLHASGASSGIVIREAVAYHQWHATRAPGNWKDSAGVERFHRNLHWHCARGIVEPLDQPRPVLRRFEAGREVERVELENPVREQGKDARMAAST
jgi:GT2 family glycosyltransferase